MAYPEPDFLTDQMPEDGVKTAGSRSRRRRRGQPALGGRRSDPSLSVARRAPDADVPRSIGPPIHGEIGVPVAVIVAGHWHVTRQSPLVAGIGRQSGARLVDVPCAGRGSKHDEIGLSVPVEIAWACDLNRRPCQSRRVDPLQPS